jgi:hypothetical protein
VAEFKRIFFGRDEDAAKEGEAGASAQRPPLVDDIRRALMERLIAFIRRLLSHEAVNSMTPRNVAICFAPSVVQPPASVSVMQAAMQVGIAIDVLEGVLHAALDVFPRSEDFSDDVFAAPLAPLAC